MATLLVIGGSGFFGKSILDGYRRGLLEQWSIDRIKIFSRNASSLKHSNPELITDSIELLDGDITSCSQLPQAEYVMHAAASTDATRYLERPLEERKNILSGVVNYCNLAPKFNIDSKIIYISSGAYYGKQPSDLEYLDEEYIPGPLNLMDPLKRDYAAAKRDAEEAIKELGEMGLKVSIARCFAFVGRYLPLNQHFAIGNFIQSGLKKKAIEVKSNNLVIRSYMYADDLVIWLMTILESSSVACPIYNVGSDKEISLVELSNKVSKLCKVECYINVDSTLEADRYVPSTQKAKRNLKLKLRYDLSSAIEKTISKIRESES